MARWTIGRVSSKADFALLRAGKRAHDGVLRVSFVPGCTCPNVAFAISRHVGNAVARNLLRRRLRALLVEFGPSNGLYLVSAAPGAAALSFKELSIQLAGVLDRVGARPRQTLPAATAQPGRAL